MNMTVIKSKIKTIFGKHENLLRYIAAICDNRRIESNAEKMIILGDLLFTYGYDFEILGGATNRIALQIDGYAVKFAMDEQGYRDNLIEYSLSPELQPYVTKSYETNGYILIAEYVEVINTSEKWQLYDVEIRKILDRLCNDYLLGDVGYIKKNMTNWGLRDGEPVILDYAYCHRFTENLFTCSKCGSPLTYDSSYDKLMCTNRSGCKAIYTYNERKRVQGEQVDIDMIVERKAASIKMPKGVLSKEISVYQEQLIGDNQFLIDTPEDYSRYQKLKEELEMKVFLNGEEGTMNNSIESKFSAMLRIMQDPNDEEARNILYEDLSEVPEPVFTENYQENYMNGHPIGIRMNYNPSDDDDTRYDEDRDDDPDEIEANFTRMIQALKEDTAEAERQAEEMARAQEEAYFESVRERMEKSQGVSISYQEDSTLASDAYIAPEEDTNVGEMTGGMMEEIGNDEYKEPDASVVATQTDSTEVKTEVEIDEPKVDVTDDKETKPEVAEVTPEEKPKEVEVEATPETDKSEVVTVGEWQETQPVEEVTTEEVTKEPETSDDNSDNEETVDESEETEDDASDETGDEETTEDEAEQAEEVSETTEVTDSAATEEPEPEDVIPGFGGNFSPNETILVNGKPLSRGEEVTVNV